MSSAIETGSGELRLADNVKALHGLLRRRWLTLATVTAVVFALAATLIMLMTPAYQATARIQLDPARDPMAGAQADTRVDLGSEFIETEVTVLNSQEIARNVVRRLGLQNDPEFTKDLDPVSEGPAGVEERLSSVVRAVKRKLNVGRDRLTYVINVNFESDDPQKAADIANAFAEEYIRGTVGSRVGTAESQAEFFKRQLAELGAEARNAEAALAQYRAQSGISPGNGAATIVDQQIGPLSSQLATAESEAAEARAELGAARTQIQRGGLDSVSAVRTSNVVADLRRQRAEVLRTLGDISTRYGPRHPESIKVKQQLEELDNQIRDEANRAVSSLEAAARAADARASSLRSSLRQLQSEQAHNTRAGSTAESLDREAKTKREAYDRMAQLSLESMQTQRSEIAPATIIDRAVPPSQPASPRRALLLALALVVALACGSATIITQELLVPGIRDVSEFEKQLGLPVLAAVPKATGERTPADLVIDRSTSLFGESMRIARASILGVRSTRPIKVVAFTSAVPAEGKTTTALAFARTLAISGSRTLIIDCDLRRAALLANSAKAGDAGLVEVLTGQVPCEHVIIPDAVEGLDLLPVVRPYHSSEDLFGGGDMSGLLAQLRERYDYIVLDLPPILGLADSRFVAAMADAVVMVVRWAKTPMSAVSTALGQLETDEVPVIGGIFAMVDPASEAIGGMYYSSKYASYYNAR